MSPLTLLIAIPVAIYFGVLAFWMGGSVVMAIWEGVRRYRAGEMHFAVGAKGKPDGGMV